MASFLVGIVAAGLCLRRRCRNRIIENQELARGTRTATPCDIMATNTNPTNGITKTLLVIAIIGALNWGLVGFFNFNLVHAIFGGAAIEQASTASRVVYAIVGLCGLASLFLLPKVHAEPIDTSRMAHRAS
ncbi:MAG: hypothetical protein JWO36_6126 [Myxococcales bacterium]|nr:hypothetical protein [Myxococcales bacterium]